MQEQLGTAKVTGTVLNSQTANAARFHDNAKKGNKGVPLAGPPPKKGPNALNSLLIGCWYTSARVPPANGRG